MHKSYKILVEAAWPVVRVLDFKYGDPEFKSRSDH